MNPAPFRSDIMVAIREDRNSTPRRKAAKTQSDSTADDADEKRIFSGLCAFASLR